MHAVNGFHPWCDNYQTVHPNRATAGHDGQGPRGHYKSDFTNYRDKLCLWLHGTRTLVADGTPDKPIAIVAAGDGDVSSTAPEPTSASTSWPPTICTSKD